MEKEARKNHLAFLDDYHIHQVCRDHPGPFYTVHGKLISGITGAKDVLDYFGDNLLVLELVGERSKTFNLDIDNLSHDENIDNILEAITSYKRRLVIFSGKVFVRLLGDYLEGVEPIFASKNRNGHSLNIYWFKIDGINCVLFDKFLSRGSCYGLTDKHLRETIPYVIREQLEK